MALSLIVGALAGVEDSRGCLGSSMWEIPAFRDNVRMQDYCAQCRISSKFSGQVWIVHLGEVFD